MWCSPPFLLSEGVDPKIERMTRGGEEGGGAGAPIDFLIKYDRTKQTPRKLSRNIPFSKFDTKLMRNLVSPSDIWQPPDPIHIFCFAPPLMPPFQYSLFTIHHSLIFTFWLKHDMKWWSNSWIIFAFFSIACCTTRNRIYQNQVNEKFLFSCGFLFCAIAELSSFDQFPLCKRLHLRSNFEKMIWFFCEAFQIALKTYLERSYDYFQETFQTCWNSIEKSFDCF